MKPPRKPLYPGNYRYYEATFEEIGAALGISKQRAEQHYVNALAKLRASGMLDEWLDLVLQSNQGALQ